MTSTYDYDDPAIRQMVEDRHAPEEMFVKRLDGTTLVQIICEADSESWPCVAVVGLRSWVGQA